MVFGGTINREDFIFITANGVVGHRAAVRLLKAGCKVRVGVTEPEESSAQDLKKQGADICSFSWDDESTFAPALDSVRSVLCVVDPLLHQNWSEHFLAFFDACRSSGVSHFVKVSFYHALTGTRARVMKNFHVALPAENPFQHIPLVQEHGNCDEKLIRSKMDFTILFATHKMSDPILYQSSTLKEEYPKFHGASGGKKVNYVSPNDIASAAVRVLVDGPKQHHRVGYNLTSPTPITDEAVAELFSEQLSKTVTYVDMDFEDFKAQEKFEGEPDWVVANLVPLEKMKATGTEIDFESKDFEKICGRPAETFEEYLSSKEDMTPSELTLFTDVSTKEVGQ